MKLRLLLFLAALAVLGPHAIGQPSVFGPGINGGPNSSVFGPNPVNTLNVGLAAFWNLNEFTLTGSNRADCVGTHTLTDIANDVSSVTGKINRGATFGQLNGNEGLTTSSSDFNMAVGASFTVSLWFNAGAGFGNATYPLIAKATNQLSNCDFAIFCDASVQNFHFQWHGATGFNQTANLATLGTFTNNTWQFLVFGFDSTNQVIWFSINGGPRLNAASETAVQWSTAPLTFMNYGPTGGHPFGGQLDAIGFWTNRVLTTLEVAQLWNNSNGQECPLQWEGLPAPGQFPDPTFNAWMARLFASQGAFPSANTANSVSNFWNGLASDGIQNLMVMVNCVVTDNLTAASSPLLPGTGAGGATIWVNNGPFVAGDLGVNGITGNGSTKYFDTGISMNNLTATSHGVQVYGYNLVSSATDCDMGANDASTGIILFLDLSGSLKSYDGSISGNIITVSTPLNGYYCASRVSSTDHRVFFANSGNAHAQFGTTDATSFSSSIAARNLFVFVQNASTGVGNFSSDTISFVSISKGLSLAQDASLFNRVQTMRQAFGGGFR